MIAARRGRDKPCARLVLLLVLMLLGVGYGLADDLDFPDILTPGGGGDQTGGGNTGNGHHGGRDPLELYLAGMEGASFRPEEQGAFQGLVFSETNFDLQARLWHEGEQLDPLSPYPRALLLADPDACVVVARDADSLNFEGRFALYANLPTLLQGFGLFLAPSKEARLVVTVVRISNDANPFHDDPVDWVLHGPDGGMETFTHTGRFSLADLLLSLFTANPEVRWIGLLQEEFDAAGNVVGRKTMMLRKEAPLLEIIQRLGPALKEAMEIRFSSSDS